MTLTKTGTDGIKDDAVTLDKLAHGTSSQDGKFLRANNGAAPSFETVSTDLVGDTSPQLGGNLDSNGNNIGFLDGDQAKFGTGNDMTIFHSADINQITTGTKALQILAGGSNNKKIFASNPSNNAAELYFDNTKKLETSNSGVMVTGANTSGSTIKGSLTLMTEGGSSNIEHIGANGTLRFYDNKKATFGSSDDLQIFHNGSNSKIDNSTGTLYIQGDTITLTGQGGSENLAVFTKNGGVELFYDGTAKLETRSGDTIFHDDIRIQDNNKINLGTLDDLQIYHDGSYNFIRSENGHPINFIKSTTENIAKFIPDGGVELYHNNVKKLSTTADGICFNSDTAAANALDDYEEGSWTASIISGGTGINNDSSNNRYVKIGSMVFVTFEVSGLTSPNNGAFEIGGLPYAVATGREGTGSCMTNNVTYWSNRTMANVYAFAGQAKFRIYANGDGTTWRAVTGSDFTTNGSCIGSLAYHTV